MMDEEDGWCPNRRDLERRGTYGGNSDAMWATPKKIGWEEGCTKGHVVGMVIILVGPKQ